MSELSMSEMNLHLSHLDFKRDASDMRSNSFQSLLMQNEELAARLRVAIQRMASYEQEHAVLAEKISHYTTENSALSDQVLIFKEKDKLRSHDVQKVEVKFEEKIALLKKEELLLRQRLEVMEKLEEKILRYKKYQERIKNSVKPYVTQLKKYSETLSEKNLQLEAQILAAEEELRRQDEAIAKQKETMERVWVSSQNEKNQLVVIFEEERTSLREEIKTLQAKLEVGEEKTRILDRSLERQDELENLIVSLRRSRDTDKEKFNASFQEQHEKILSMQQELTEKRLLNEDLVKESAELRKEIADLRQKDRQNVEQLTSLRYLWTQQGQENETLKTSVRALEKINSDLSKKLNSLRQEKSPGAE